MTGKNRTTRATSAADTSQGELSPSQGQSAEGQDSLTASGTPGVYVITPQPSKLTNVSVTNQQVRTVHRITPQPSKLD